jgi:hypothetical protein
VSGIFVLSIDTEDAIGPRSWHTSWNVNERRHEAWRETVTRFTRLLDGHAVSSTWVVGEAAVFQAWGRRRTDGSSDVAECLVDAIGAMATRQEIALSPSHVNAAASDGRGGVARCLRLSEQQENVLRTLAVPVDAEIDIDRYAALGITACRLAPPATLPSPLTDDLFQRPLPIWRPSDLDRSGSILMVPISVRIGSIDNRRRLVPEAARIARVRRALDRAASEGAVVHIAFQLTDLEISEALFRTIEDILFQVSERRAGGALRVATIADLRRVHDAETADTAHQRAA